MSLLCEIKKFLSKNFDMKYLSEGSFVLEVQIRWDYSQCVLQLSQKSYIERVHRRFGIQDCKPRDNPIAKGNKFSFSQYPNNDLESKEVEKVPHASTVASIMYVQAFTHLDIT